MWHHLYHNTQNDESSNSIEMDHDLGDESSRVCLWPHIRQCVFCPVPLIH